MWKQIPPYAIKVDVTEGCCLYHKFCGLSAIRKGPGNYKHMSLKIATTLAEQIKDAGWFGIRLEFGVRGEPTRNPELYDILKVFRKNLPHASMLLTTNGGGLRSDTENKIKQMMENLNALMLSKYSDSPAYGVVATTMLQMGIPTCQFSSRKGTFEHHPYQRWKPNEKMFFLGEDITKMIGGRIRRLSNQGCCTGKPDFSFLKKRCARPFREATVAPDGTVILCCIDWLGLYKIGNIKDISLDHLWQSERYNAARRILLDKGRILPPCYGCDSLSFTVGLLPNGGRKNYSKHMSKSTERDISVWEDVIKEPPMCPPVQPLPIDNVGIREHLQ